MADPGDRGGVACDLHDHLLIRPTERRKILAVNRFGDREKGRVAEQPQAACGQPAPAGDGS